jgi:carboxyl-terminal processing protease
MSRGTRRSLFFVLLVIVLCGFLGAAFPQRGSSPYMTGASDSDVRDSLHQFSEIYNLVEQNYAEPVNPDKAIYNGAIPGMLHVLDPHSNFFDPKSYSLLREEQSGKYYGVGMQIAPRNNKIIIVAPFAGTPAYKAGLRPGDVIIAVDGKATDNLSVSDVADMLKGPKGTNVHISILREATDKPLEFNLVRDEIPRNSVDLKFMIRPGVGYMHVSGAGSRGRAAELWRPQGLGTGPARQSWRPSE